MVSDIHRLALLHFMQQGLKQKRRINRHLFYQNRQTSGAVGAENKRLLYVSRL